jgi:hypothetical protein
MASPIEKTRCYDQTETLDKDDGEENRHRPSRAGDLVEEAWLTVQIFLLFLTIAGGFSWDNLVPYGHKGGVQVRIKHGFEAGAVYMSGKFARVNFNHQSIFDGFKLNVRFEKS